MIEQLVRQDMKGIQVGTMMDREVGHGEGKEKVVQHRMTQGSERDNKFTVVRRERCEKRKIKYMRVLRHPHDPRRWQLTCLGPRGRFLSSGSELGQRWEARGK